MRKLVLILGILVILALVAIRCNHLHTPVASVPEAQVETSAVNNLPPPQAAAKTDGYRLIAGANPQLNRKQVFLPPTNSVVITNEAQLSLLIEQDKKARQQQQTVQQ